MADDLNLAIEVGIEDLNREFNEKTVSYASCEFGNAIEHLANALDTIQKEFNMWNSKIKNSLEGLDTYFNKNL